MKEKSRQTDFSLQEEPRKKSTHVRRWLKMYLERDVLKKKAIKGVSFIYSLLSTKVYIIYKLYHQQ